MRWFSRVATLLFGKIIHPFRPSVVWKAGGIVEFVPLISPKFLNGRRSRSDGEVEKEDVDFLAVAIHGEVHHFSAGALPYAVKFYRLCPVFACSSLLAIITP